MAWIESIMRGLKRECTYVVVLVLMAVSVPTNSASAQPVSAPPTQSCTLDLGPRVTVTGIKNSETLELSDGRSVRLIGALGPRPPLNTASEKNWPAETQATAALEKLVLGRDVRLGFGPVKTDRYGRLLAHVFGWQHGRRYWVQGELLAHGHARAYALRDHSTCLRELLAHERLAKTPARGLWLRRAYRELRPAPPRWLLANRRHQFALITGIVRNVAIVRSAVYLNFGEQWRTDFTASTTRRALRESGLSVAQMTALKGKRVRVRGWIERRNGPFIALADPRLIEVLDAETPQSQDTPTPPPLVASGEFGDAGEELDGPLWVRKRRLPMPQLKSSAIKKQNAR